MELARSSYQESRWENITWENCRKSYGHNFITDRHDVFIVTNESYSFTKATKNVVHYGLQLPIKILDDSADARSEPYDWNIPEPLSKPQRARI